MRAVQFSTADRVQSRETNESAGWGIGFLRDRESVTHIDRDENRTGAGMERCGDRDEEVKKADDGNRYPGSAF